SDVPSRECGPISQLTPARARRSAAWHCRALARITQPLDVVRVRTPPGALTSHHRANSLIRVIPAALPNAQPPGPVLSHPESHRWAGGNGGSPRRRGGPVGSGAPVLGGVSPRAQAHELVCRLDPHAMITQGARNRHDGAAAAGTSNVRRCDRVYP